MTEFQIHNVMRIEDREIMLGLDVSLREAIDWCFHYNSFNGKPYPNGEGWYNDDFVVVRLDVDLCEYLTIQ